jgi:WD40 repeat protein
MKQVGLALHNYHSTNDAFPPLALPTRGLSGPTYADHQGPSVLLLALGYIEGQSLYNAFNFNLGCVLPGCDGASLITNATVVNSQVKTFICPSNPYSSEYPYSTNYGASVGPQFRWDGTSGGVGVGVFAAQKTRGLSQITDGASSTVAFSEINTGDNQIGSHNHTEFFTGVPWPSNAPTGNGYDQVATNPAGYANNQAYTRACDVQAASSKVFDWARKETLATFAGHADTVFAVAFTPDGRQVATGGGDGLVRIWDPSNDARQSATLGGFKGPVFRVRFTPDGKHLVAGSADRTLRVFEGSVPRLTLSGHADWIHALAISPDGESIASGSWDGEVRLWRLADGTPVATILAAPGLSRVARANPGP